MAEGKINLKANDAERDGARHKNFLARKFWWL